LLARAGDPFLAQWEIDLTSKASHALYEQKIDQARLREVEVDVTRYMVENFSFAVLRFDTMSERLQYEECFLSTIHECRDCGPSDKWLARSHPKSEVIRTSGLWNVQSLAGKVLSIDEAKCIVAAGISL
jgi:hypothetical protein